jgi:hypothetical protein
MSLLQRISDFFKPVPSTEAFIDAVSRSKVHRMSVRACLKLSIRQTRADREPPSNPSLIQTALAESSDSPPLSATETPIDWNKLPLNDAIIPICFS